MRAIGQIYEESAMQAVQPRGESHDGDQKSSTINTGSEKDAAGTPQFADTALAQHGTVVVAPATPECQGSRALGLSQNRQGRRCKDGL